MRPLRSQAPNCALRSMSVPAGQLAHELEKGDVDVAVGYFPTLATRNFRQRRLSTHRFACLLRADHPARAERLSVKAFLEAEHIVVGEEGRSQEVLERFFKRRRLGRKVAVYASHFLGVPSVLAQSDLIATIPYAAARQFAAMSPRLAVALPPFDIAGFDLKLHWHRRFDNEPRNKWLRDQLIEIFSEDRRSTLPPGRGTAAPYSAIE
jgi:DNA-binding transcriptional LysR family regulator